MLPNSLDADAGAAPDGRVSAEWMTQCRLSGCAIVTSIPTSRRSSLGQVRQAVQPTDGSKAEVKPAGALFRRMRRWCREREGLRHTG
jgi:hypothetical protein